MVTILPCLCFLLDPFQPAHQLLIVPPQHNELLLAFFELVRTLHQQFPQGLIFPFQFFLHGSPLPDDELTLFLHGVYIPDEHILIPTDIPHHLPLPPHFQQCLLRLHPRHFNHLFLQSHHLNQSPYLPLQLLPQLQGILLQLLHLPLVNSPHSPHLFILLLLSSHSLFLCLIHLNFPLHFFPLELLMLVLHRSLTQAESLTLLLQCNFTPIPILLQVGVLLLQFLTPPLQLLDPTFKKLLLGLIVLRLLLLIRNDLLHVLTVVPLDILDLLHLLPLHLRDYPLIHGDYAVQGLLYPVSLPLQVLHTVTQHYILGLIFPNTTTLLLNSPQLRGLTEQHIVNQLTRGVIQLAKGCLTVFLWRQISQSL